MRERQWIELGGQLLDTLRITLSRPSLWVPSLLVLLPTLALQIAAPTYLRTRLSPSPYFVVAGGLLLVLLTQVGLPAAIALVHARRTGASRPDMRALLSVSVRVGVRTFLGLIAGAIPGLWLQARYAFASLCDACDEPLAASATATKPAARELLLLSFVALLASLLGQSLVAVVNESLGVVHAIGTLDGRTVFGLNYPAHIVTTIVAYYTAAFAVTLQAVGTSVVYEAAVEDARTARVRPRFEPRQRTLAIRLAQSAAVLAVLAGLVATAYKVNQHLN
jgi:hypothetical protein